MSLKMQIHSLSKLYSIYEEVPGNFLDETDVDTYLNFKFFEIFQSNQRILRASKGSNKINLAIKLFWFCDIKTQQR